MSHYWDSTEEKLLAVESHKLDANSSPSSESSLPSEEEKKLSATTTSVASVSTLVLTTNSSGSALEDEKKAPLTNTNAVVTYSQGDAEITLFFVSAEYGVLMQDSFPIKHGVDALVGIQVPYVYFVHIDQALQANTFPRSVTHETGLFVLYWMYMSKTSVWKHKCHWYPHLECFLLSFLIHGCRVKKQVMRDFVSLESVDDEIKKVSEKTKQNKTKQNNMMMMTIIFLLLSFWWKVNQFTCRFLMCRTWFNSASI